jgi:hypothetical protein
VCVNRICRLPVCLPVAIDADDDDGGGGGFSLGFLGAGEIEGWQGLGRGDGKMGRWEMGDVRRGTSTSELSVGLCDGLSLLGCVCGCRGTSYGGRAG